MLTLKYARAWLAKRLTMDEVGQTATEYVLVILGGATNAIKNWVTSISTPPP